MLIWGRVLPWNCCELLGLPRLMRRRLLASTRRHLLALQMLCECVDTEGVASFVGFMSWTSTSTRTSNSKAFGLEGPEIPGSWKTSFWRYLLWMLRGMPCCVKIHRSSNRTRHRRKQPCQDLSRDNEVRASCKLPSRGPRFRMDRE